MDEVLTLPIPREAMMQCPGLGKAEVAKAGRLSVGAWRSYVSWTCSRLAWSAIQTTTTSPVSAPPQTRV